MHKEVCLPESLKEIGRPWLAHRPIECTTEKVLTNSCLGGAHQSHQQVKRRANSSYSWPKLFQQITKVSSHWLLSHFKFRDDILELFPLKLLYGAKETLIIELIPRKEKESSRDHQQLNHDSFEVPCDRRRLVLTTRDYLKKRNLGPF